MPQLGVRAELWVFRRVLQQGELCLKSMREIAQGVARALPTLTQDDEQAVELLHDRGDFCWHARINAVDL